MKKWIPEFLSAFHKEVMKPLGYRKSGRTFHREMGGYRERIYFQGCRRVPFCFYINVGVEFKDIQDYDCCRNFVLIPCTHWAERIRSLVPGSPGEWVIQDDTDREALKKSLSELIPRASAEMSARIGPLRDEVDDRLKKMAERRLSAGRD